MFLPTVVSAIVKRKAHRDNTQQISFAHRGHDGIHGAVDVLVEQKHEVIRREQPINHRSRGHGPCVAGTIEIHLIIPSQEGKRVRPVQSSMRVFLVIVSVQAMADMRTLV